MSLTIFLQRAFIDACPIGWTAHAEVPVIPLQLEKNLGYSSRADVLLEKNDGLRRYWIEFEVSRADPVANHAKFVTSHLFQPQAHEDVFISMVSPHVVRGRHNLAANTIFLMRAVGMRAFQTLLLPSIEPSEIKRLNHLSLPELETLSPSITGEILRVFKISEPIFSVDSQAIYFVAGYVEVLMNLVTWNREIRDDAKRITWQQYSADQYFIYDVQSGWFAPMMFCAFTPITVSTPLSVMSIEFYLSLPHHSSINEAGAMQHLTEVLGMIVLSAQDVPHMIHQFERWAASLQFTISTRSSDILFVIPPMWYQRS